MNTIRKTVAALFAVLFLISALLAQFLFNLERQAFSPHTYQQAFANEHFYERLPSILAESVSANRVPGLPLAMQGLTQQNWENFFRDLLPPDTLKLMGDQGLASILAYLNNQSDTALLSLAPLKQRMAGQAGTQAVLNLMATQPACTLEEILRITQALLSQQQLSLCNPPADLYPLVVPMIQGQLQAASSAIPDEITLAQIDPASGPDADPRPRMRLARFFMRISPVVPLLFLLGMTVLAVRDLRDWLTWWGWPLLLLGILGGAGALLAAPLAGMVLLQFLSARLPSFLPQLLIDNGSQLASAIIDQMLQPTLVQALVFTILGAAMLAAAPLWSWLKH